MLATTYASHALHCGVEERNLSSKLATYETAERHVHASIVPSWKSTQQPSIPSCGDPRVPTCAATLSPLTPPIHDSDAMVTPSPMPWYLCPHLHISCVSVPPGVDYIAGLPG